MMYENISNAISITHTIISVKDNIFECLIRPCKHLCITVNI